MTTSPRPTRGPRRRVSRVLLAMIAGLTSLLGSQVLVAPAAHAESFEIFFAIKPNDDHRTRGLTWSFDAAGPVVWQCAFQNEIVPCASGYFFAETPRGGRYRFDIYGQNEGKTAFFTQIVEVDLPPIVTLTQKPDQQQTASFAGLTPYSSGFRYTSDQDGSTYACRVDFRPLPCNDVGTIWSNVANGVHTFDVQGTSPKGQVGPKLEYTWSVSNAPPIPDTSLTGYPPNPSASGAATFVLASDLTGATFECSLDNAPFTACTSPHTVTGLSAGPHHFEARARNANGYDWTPAFWEWTANPPPAPDTTITSGPSGSSAATTASVSFSSDRQGASFECSLDDAPFVACTSPRQLSGLAVGPHTFRVRAVADGVTDASPASASWTVTAPPPAPDTTITSGPSGSTTATTAEVAFTSGRQGASFECSLDDTPFVACTSPRQLTGLTVGDHTFRVRAIADGVTDPTPASASWTVTAPPVAPDTTITQKPAASSSATSATFAFAADQAGATFECKLDSGAFTACTSPTSYPALAVGSHTFTVRAAKGGLTDATPASYTWSVTTAPDTTPPSTTISGKDGQVVKGTTVTFTLGSPDKDVASYRCKLDSAALKTCPKSVKLTGLKPGNHTLTAVAVDQAGNVDKSPAVRKFVVKKA
ncbi:hypothetical protein [Nocardioides sp.]|uniref:hypothetical protein n=1 Tax=Nocardioides sp. TaxID=35761 RepID=UPI003512F284